METCLHCFAVPSQDFLLMSKSLKRPNEHVHTPRSQTHGHGRSPGRSRSVSGAVRQRPSIVFEEEKKFKSRRRTKLASPLPQSFPGAVLFCCPTAAPLSGVPPERDLQRERETDAHEEGEEGLKKEEKKRANR